MNKMKKLVLVFIAVFCELVCSAQTTGVGYLQTLRAEDHYQKEDTTGYPSFIYRQYYKGVGPNTLHNPCNYFQLDSIAGNGDDVSRMLNVLQWTNRQIPHNGSNLPVSEMTAIDIYNYSKANGNIGVNCMGLAIFFNECMLSLGYPSRVVWCNPKDPKDTECHVINAVYSETMDKWLWLDPSFNVYIMNKDGAILSIQEVREKMIRDEPLSLNDDCNLGSFAPADIQGYLYDYMSKNLYWFTCVSLSTYNLWSNYIYAYMDTDYYTISLVPLGYSYENDHWEDVLKTSDPEYFWQRP